MKHKLGRRLVVVALVFLVACTSAPAPSVTPARPASAPTATPSKAPTATNTPSPVPTDTATPKPTATPVPVTPTPIPPTATPRPATHTVCAGGCDFTTIQAAVDDPSTVSNAILEVRDPVHTEAGIVVSPGIEVTIRGLGADETIVQAHETPEEAPERVFLIEERATVVLERLTIRHGRPSRDEECGGGIMNLGSVTIDQCAVVANRSNSGAGICNRGTLTIRNTSVSDNFADGVGPSGYACGSGGGIKCERGALALVNSTISGNISEDADIHADRARGGGVHVGCNCTAVFTNSTISGNTSVAYAGGVYIKGALRLVNCTITGNRTTGEGGGVYVRGHMDVLNTIMAGNAGKGGNCVIGGPGGYQGKGEIGLNSNNLVVGGACAPAFVDDPLLGPLADNGGDTLTHALLPGSPAIDAIPAISCTLRTDQRGAPRPTVQMSTETPCDIGAFEVQPEASGEASPPAESPPQMVLVPAGPFTMGSEEGRADERPVHTVTLDAFVIDVREVTNADFAAFLNDRGNKEEGGVTWLDVEDQDCLIKKRGAKFVPKTGVEDHPVIEVTWLGAAAYCEWRGQLAGEPLRLPTEAEWEKAASWDPTMGVKRIYPWGDAWDTSLVNADWPITATTELTPHAAPVGSYLEGASPSGALDMAGNAWEWVADWYASDYYSRSPSQNPQGPDVGEDKVVRGGSWRSPSEFARTTVRHHWFPDHTFDIGFRCARFVEGESGP